MSDNRLTRLAVLIDADNVSAQIADGLFKEIAKLGEASVRRIYGDFSGQRLKTWADILAQHAIQPHQQFANTTGKNASKNASDIALVIDAMDLLHRGRCDGFCLVSSDSDFTRLAARIREEGVQVFGFGERKTPESFRQACHRFIYTEDLGHEAPAYDTNFAALVKPLEPLSAAVAIFRNVIDRMDSEDGWVNLAEFGGRLHSIYTNFDEGTYGCKKLKELIENTKAFELDEPEGGGLRIRLKTNRPKKAHEAEQLQP